MATLRIRPNGSFDIDFTFMGQRKTIPLSPKKYTEKTASKLEEIVTKLVFCLENDNVPDKMTVKWIKSTTPEIRKKLAKFGLIEILELRTVKELWTTFREKKQNIKESTMETYRHSERRFFEFFKPDEVLTAITPARIRAWKEFLLTQAKNERTGGRGLSIATTAGTLTKCKAIFNHAVNIGWLEKSPLTGIKRGSFINRSKDRYVKPSEYFKLLDAAPCSDWRTIISLARIGGLRARSEILNLKWSDINWDQNKFWVTSPKTERYEGKEGRWVPLFPELRWELEALWGEREAIWFDLPENKRQFVINRYRSTSQNIGTTFSKIVKKAGIEPFKKPFNNMRASRSIEIYVDYSPLHECEWVGHSQSVALKHYLKLRDEDFDIAANGHRPKITDNLPTEVREEDFVRAAAVESWGNGFAPQTPQVSSTNGFSPQTPDVPSVVEKSVPTFTSTTYDGFSLRGVESIQMISIR